MSELESIFRLIQEIFTEQDIRILLAGGHAVNVHGVTRATVDVDFVIDARYETEVRNLMKAQGYVNQSSHGNVLFCNRPESTLRIDFLKTDPVTMDQLWGQRILPHPEGAPGCPVVSLEHLVAMKIAALRENFDKRHEKDLPDILRLAARHDWSWENHLQPLVKRFGSPELSLKLHQAWENRR